MTTDTLKGIISAPRWMGAGRAIRNLCLERGLVGTIESERGWIMETVRIDVTGPADAVRAMRWTLQSMDGER